MAIVLLYVCCSLAFVAGIVCLVAARRRGRSFAARGTVLLLASMSVLVCARYLPLDLILGGGERRFRIGRVDGYAVDAVQRLGVDCFDCYFEITTSDGRVAKVMIDPDGDGWDGSPLLADGRRVYVVLDRSRGVEAGTPYVDLGAGTVFSPIGGERKRDAMQFDGDWN